MSLITISQSMGSADPGIAQSVAQKLEVELFDDVKLREHGLQLGIQTEDLKGLDQKAPGFFDRFLSTRPKSYIHFLESVIYKVAKAGRGVIVGHGSQILLRDFGCALHVLIHAPETYRIENVAKKHGMSTKDAQKLIQKSDNEKKRFFNFAFTMNWDDPALYDLMINTGKLGNEAAVNLIIETARMDAIKSCSLTALETMDRLSQESAIRALLLKQHLNLSLLHVEVPRKGTVVLRGVLNSEDDKEQIVKLVQSVAGVVEIELEISVRKDIGD